MSHLDHIAAAIPLPTRMPLLLSNRRSRIRLIHRGTDRAISVLSERVGLAYIRSMIQIFLTLIALLLFAAPAQAAFPGVPGPIVYTKGETSDGGVRLVGSSPTVLDEATRRGS